MLKAKISVVIPALNEPYLPKLIKKLKGYDVHIETEKGLSYAVWNGIQKAENEIVCIMDADGSHPTGSIMGMCSRLSLSGSQVWFVIGSRYVKDGYSEDGTVRKIMSLFYCFLARLLICWSIHDCMSGFWIGYRDKFVFEPNGNYKFGLQLLKKYKGHIIEYPIVFHKRQEGKSHLKPMQVIGDLFEIVKVKGGM